MTAKEYLKQIAIWQRKIESIETRSKGRITRLEQRVEELYAQASGLKAITYDKDRVQVSPENALPQLVIEIDETSRELSNAIIEYRLFVQGKIQQYEEKIDAIVDQINSLDDSRYSELLTLRYVKDKRFEEIACIMGYTFRHVTRLHGEALRAFQKYLS